MDAPLSNETEVAHMSDAELHTVIAHEAYSERKKIQARAELAGRLTAAQLTELLVDMRIRAATYLEITKLSKDHARRLLVALMDLEARRETLTALNRSQP